MELVLLIADVAHGGADGGLDLGLDAGSPAAVFPDALAADLAGQHHQIGRRQGLAGDPRLGIARQEQIHDRVGDAVRDLVGMALGHAFRGEEERRTGQGQAPEEGSAGGVARRHIKICLYVQPVSAPRGCRPGKAAASPASHRSITPPGQGIELDQSEQPPRHDIGSQADVRVQPQGHVSNHGQDLTGHGDQQPPAVVPERHPDQDHEAGPHRSTMTPRLVGAPVQVLDEHGGDIGQEQDTARPVRSIWPPFSQPIAKIASVETRERSSEAASPVDKQPRLIRRQAGIDQLAVSAGREGASAGSRWPPRSTAPADAGWRPGPSGSDQHGTDDGRDDDHDRPDQRIARGRPIAETSTPRNSDAKSEPAMAALGPPLQAWPRPVPRQPFQGPALRGWPGLPYQNPKTPYTY